MKILRKINFQAITLIKTFQRQFSISQILKKTHCCKLLVVGGGTGGCSVSARFAKEMCKHEIIVIEPCELHYYQSLFTLVGAGLRNLRDSCHPMIQVLHPNVTWVKSAVTKFCPESNKVITSNEDEIEYEFMVIALGIKMDYDKILNLKDALDNYDDVTTIYSPDYVNKTFKSFKQFVSGTAIFTHPVGAVKCPGASQKICYIAEHYFRLQDKRCEADIMYVLPASEMFPVQKYADILKKLTKNRKIDVHFRTELVEIIPEENKAFFRCLDNPCNKICIEYSLLHVTPPMSPPEALKQCKELVNKNGFVDIDNGTLRHKKYKNIFCLGDCSSTPNSKTNSAIGPQSLVVYKNLKSVFDGKDPPLKYTGYSACPIITGYGTALLAEFDYTIKPLETFPFEHTDGSFAFFLKTNIMPHIYWKLLLNGWWDGPELFRKIFHLKIRG